MSVGSRCPRLLMVRRGNPLQPTPPGDGLRPTGSAATLRSPQLGSAAPAWANAHFIERFKSFPYEGKGDRVSGG